MNRATVSPRAKTLSSIALPVRWLALSCAVCWAASGVDAADDGKQTYTDPSKVPPSYAVQGEYVGVVGQENQRCAAQIIALGDERFRLVGYLGGLPGDGWQTDTERVEVEGERRGDMVVFEREGIEIEWTEGTLSVIVQEDGVAIGELNRTVRMSPSLGKEPPADAVVLFDGSSAEAFKNGKIVQDDLLLADCQSKEAFGDHSLHLEFRTPFKPAARGQARGNSGVYVQSRYEIQVLDSFGLSGESNECGGIYRVAEPKVNMCYPPLQWQTYDIDFTAARYNDAGEKIKNAKITVRHNGVVIHDDLELPSHTPGKAQEADTPGPLYLQGHGNPVVYRNIWVVPR